MNSWKSELEKIADLLPDYPHELSETKWCDQLLSGQQLNISPHWALLIANTRHPLSFAGI